MAQISAPANARDREIGRHGAEPRPPAVAHHADGQAMQHEELDRPGRCRTAPADGDRGGSAAGPSSDSARYSATVSVSMSPMPRRSRLPRGGVMRRRGCAPEAEGRQGEHAGDAADPVVGQRLRKNEPWPQSCWIMNSRTRKPAAEDDQRQRQPIADMERRPGQHPEGDERHDGDGDFDDAARRARLVIAREGPAPGSGVRHNGRGVLAMAQGMKAFFLRLSGPAAAGALAISSALRRATPWRVSRRGLYRLMVRLAISETDRGSPTDIGVRMGISIRYMASSTMFPEHPCGGRDREL